MLNGHYFRYNMFGKCFLADATDGGLSNRCDFVPVENPIEFRLCIRANRLAVLHWYKLHNVRLSLVNTLIIFV